MDNNTFSIKPLLFLLILLGVCIGVVIGVSIAHTSHQQDICKAICVTVEDYMSCNSKDWNDIMKQIPKSEILKRNNNVE